jgi:hypothetical protein
MILQLDGIVGQCGGEGRVDGGDAAVEEEAFALRTGRGVDGDGIGGGAAGGVVAVVGQSIQRKVRRGVRFNGNVRPGDVALGVLLLERKIAARIDRGDVGVGIPLGDEPLSEVGVDRDRGSRGE